MYHKSYITLGIITFFIFFLIYKIVAFQIQSHQTEQFSQAITKQNEEIYTRTLVKENFEKYISTNAYKIQVAKATQNKILPGENIINIISKEDVDGNKNIDSQEVFSETQEYKDDPTLKMTNPERWQYLFQQGMK